MENYLRQFVIEEGKYLCTKARYKFYNEPICHRFDLCQGAMLIIRRESSSVK